MRFRMYNMSRILFVLYLVFSQIIRSAVFSKTMSSAIISYVLLLCAFLSQVREDHNRIIPTNSLMMFFLFAVIELITSIVVAQDTQKSFAYLVVFIECLVVFYLIRRYSEKDHGIQFSANAFILLSFLMALTVVFKGTELYGRMSISESTNVNAVGIVMMLGIGLFLYRFIKSDKNLKTISLFIIFLFLCTYVLVLTVSKKAIIGTAALLVGWIILCYGKAFSKMNIFMRLLILTLFIGVGFYAYKWFTSYQANTYQYILYRFNSINDLSEGRSTGERLALMREGLKIFYDHPFVGVGFNNYRYYSNHMYSHCFYVEILACTGLIGTIVFMIPFISSFARYFPLLKESRRKDSWDAIEVRYLFFVFIVLFFLLWTQILFYEFELMYIMALLVSFAETFYLHYQEHQNESSLCIGVN